LNGTYHGKIVEGQRTKNDIPIPINNNPAILVNVFLSTLREMMFPNHTATMESSDKAVILPSRTQSGSYLVARRPAAICVLSPHSVMKTREKPETRGGSLGQLAFLIHAIAPQCQQPEEYEDHTRNNPKPTPRHNACNPGAQENPYPIYD
jgi:hypothetical protein